MVWCVGILLCAERDGGCGKRPRVGMVQGALGVGVPEGAVEGGLEQCGPVAAWRPPRLMVTLSA